MRLYINGRFVTRPMTGVDRVAYELTAALQQIADGLPAGSLSLQPVLPRCLPEQIAFLPESTQGAVQANSKLSGLLWEQFELPFQSSEGVSVNLCNVGPYFGKRQILMVHDAQVYLSPASYSFGFRAWYRFIQPLLARRASLLLTVSEFSKIQLEDVGVFPKGKAIVIHNGVDHLDRLQADDSLLKRHGLTPANYFLAMGSTSRHKNLQCVLDAMSACSAGTSPLVVVGGDVSTLKAKFGSSPIDRIIFLGRVSDAELKGLYSNASAFLFPSMTEGFGLPPLEAMHCGCPVIASTGGAIPEVCGDAAFYASPTEPEEWCKAIEKLSKDSDVAGNHAKLGREHARHFTWRRSAYKLLHAISDVYADNEIHEQLKSLKVL